MLGRIQRSIRRRGALDLNLSVLTLSAFTGTSLLLMVIGALFGVHSSPLTLVASGFVATVSGLAVLLPLRVAAQSVQGRRHRNLVATLSLALASEVRTIVSLGITSLINGPQEITSDMVGASIFGCMVILAVPVGVAIAESAAIERRHLTAALQAEQERLSALTDSLEQDLAETEVDLRTRVHEQLAPTVSGITALLDSELSDREARELSLRIAEAVASVVRPVSHSIAASPLSAPPPREPSASHRRLVMNDVMDVPRAIRSFWMLVTMWILMVPGAILMGTPVLGLIIFFLDSTLAACLLTVVKRVWPKRLRYLKIHLGLPLILLVLAVLNAGLQVLLSYGLLDISEPHWWSDVSWLGVPLRTALCMLVVVVCMFLDFGEQRRADLEDINTQLGDYSARLRREIWLLHRSVSLAVHGPVQSAMISTAMRLSSPIRSETSLSDARQRLENALKDIAEKQSASIDLEHRLDDLCALWDPVVHISCSMERERNSRLHHDVGLQSCVLEVCREGVSNAIRHGSATEISVVIVERGGRVAISVVDNGTGVPEDAIPGLGQSALNEICSDWCIESVSEGPTVLSATLV